MENFENMDQFSQDEEQEINPKTGQPYKFSKESRERMRQARLKSPKTGKYERTPELREQISKKMKGKKMSEETRKKMSDAKFNKSRSKEAVAKLQAGAKKWRDQSNTKKDGDK